VIDVEALVVGFLQAQPEVTAIVADRVYSDLPKTRTYPLALVQRTGGRFVTNRPQWLEEATVQIDAYGRTHKESQRLADTVLTTMGSRMRDRYPQGCVTVVRGIEFAYNPDVDVLDDDGYGRSRYTVSATVFVHP
jgi:hypothetical protein